MLLPTELVSDWQGAAIPAARRIVQTRLPRTPDAPATDYDFACEVEDAGGVIPVGCGRGLVLSDEIPMSTWLPLRAGTGIDLLVPLEWGALADEVLRRVSEQVAPGMFEHTGLSLDIGHAGATLFAACDSAERWVYGFTEIPLPRGRYSVVTCDYDLEPDHLIRIHRLARRLGDRGGA